MAWLAVGVAMAVGVTWATIAILARVPAKTHRLVATGAFVLFVVTVGLPAPTIAARVVRAVPFFVALGAVIGPARPVDP